MLIIHPHIRQVVYGPEAQQVASLPVRMRGSLELPPVPRYTVISREEFLNNSRYSRRLGGRDSTRVPPLRPADVFGIGREQPFAIQRDYRSCRAGSLQGCRSLICRACLSELSRSLLGACGLSTVFAPPERFTYFQT